MSLLTLEPRWRRGPAVSPSRTIFEHPRNVPLARQTHRGAGEVVEFARLLAATLAFYAALIVVPLLALVPLAVLGLVLGLIGVLVGG